MERYSSNDITQENGIVNGSGSSLVQSPELPVGDEELKMTQYKLLTRAELMALEDSQPKWRRIRIATLVAFWVIWVALLVALVVLVVLSPKCPPIPEQQFWQKKVGYWVDVFGFKDSNEDFIGDLRGLIDGHSYIKDTLGAEYIILDAISEGQFTNSRPKLGLIKNFDSVDEAAGSLESLKNVVKAFHKIGMEVVLSLDINSISITSDLAKSENLKMAIPATVTREGLPTTVNIGNKSYYSVGDKEMVDLNLESENVINKLKDSLKNLFQLDIDGILLKNAAFYIEDNVSQRNFSSPDTNQNKWFIQYPTGQIYSPKSVEVVTKIKKFMNENPRASGKARLLAVDAGDTGYGIDDNQEMALMFLNVSGEPAADMVISRQFVKRRGWKTTPRNIEWIQSNLANYDVASGNVKEFVALVTGTSSDRAGVSVHSMAMVLLLPGSPIIYYGNELGNDVKATTTPLSDLYPRGKTSFPNLNDEDTTLSCHLPLPWSNIGAGFSTPSDILSAAFRHFIYSNEIKETVEMATAVGRGSAPFALAKKLIELRKEPSLQWGKLEMYKGKIGDGKSSMEVFVRKAEGFPAIVVAMNNPNIASTTIQPGVTIDIKGNCLKAKMAYAYPSYENLSKDEELIDQSVYLPITSGPAVYVLKCLE